jgi:hypothetical protein
VQHRKKPSAGVAILDWFLTTSIVALLGVGVLYVLSEPAWWCWCLDKLDARDWGHRTWTGVITAMLIVLAAIRYWPEKRKEADTSEKRG